MEAMKKGQRELRTEDINYFEGEQGLFKVLAFVIKTLARGKEKFLTSENFNLYLDWSNQDFTHLSENDVRDKELVGRVLGVHNLLCFIFDFLAIAFSSLITAEKTPEKS